LVPALRRPAPIAPPRETEIAGLSCEAAEGTRTLDLLHGKRRATAGTDAFGMQMSPIRTLRRDAAPGGLGRILRGSRSEFVAARPLPRLIPVVAVRSAMHMRGLRAGRQRRPIRSAARFSAWSATTWAWRFRARVSVVCTRPACVSHGTRVRGAARGGRRPCAPRARDVTGRASRRRAVGARRGLRA
jgi:hypothetical protein